MKLDIFPHSYLFLDGNYNSDSFVCLFTHPLEACLLQWLSLPEMELAT